MWSKIDGFIVSIETVWKQRWYPRLGDSAYERGGDGRWKFWIKPLKETVGGWLGDLSTIQKEDGVLAVGLMFQ